MKEGSQKSKVPVNPNDWLEFERQHLPEVVATVLSLLNLRGISIQDFVGAWRETNESLPLALHFLWRKSAGARKESDE